MFTSKKSGKNYFHLGIYGLAHLIVDAICVGVVLSYFSKDITSAYMPVDLVVYYNLIAFGMQPIFGYLADRTCRSKEIAVIGMMAVAAAIGVMSVPYVAVPLLAIGNAMFHVGGGIASLYFDKGKAALPGIFVAPGAIGVFLAIFLAESTPMIYLLGLILLICTVYFTRSRYEQQIEYEPTEPLINSKMVMIVMTLLSVICVRSLIGGALVFAWQSTMVMKVAALAMIVGGKALGGILGDRLGFVKVGVGGLVVAAPLLSFGMGQWYLALIGLLAFNLTMPITLTALASAFRRYKGFAFGLTTLAIAVGYLMNRYLSGYYVNNALFIGLVILLSALWLFQGLNNHQRTNQSSQEIEGLES